MDTAWDGNKPRMNRRTTMDMNWSGEGNQSCRRVTSQVAQNKHEPLSRRNRLSMDMNWQGGNTAFTNHTSNKSAHIKPRYRKNSMDMNRQGCISKKSPVVPEKEVVLRGETIPTIAEANAKRLQRRSQSISLGLVGQYAVETIQHTVHRHMSLDLSSGNNFARRTFLPFRRSNSLPEEMISNGTISDEKRQEFMRKIDKQRTQFHKQVMECNPEEWKEIQNKLRKSKARTNAGLAIALDCHLVDCVSAKQNQPESNDCDSSEEDGLEVGWGTFDHVQRNKKHSINLNSTSQRFNLVSQDVLKSLADDDQRGSDDDDECGVHDDATIKSYRHALFDILTFRGALSASRTINEDTEDTRGTGSFQHSLGSDRRKEGWFGWMSNHNTQTHPDNRRADFQASKFKKAFSNRTARWLTSRNTQFEESSSSRNLLGL